MSDYILGGILGALFFVILASVFLAFTSCSTINIRCFNAEHQEVPCKTVREQRP